MFESQSVQRSHFTVDHSSHQLLTPPVRSVERTNSCFAFCIDKMWPVYIIAVAIAMVVTGTINTMSMKWADKINATGYDGLDREFDHPVLQTVFMFLGEFSCFLVFQILWWYFSRRPTLEEDEHELIKGNKEFNIFYFLPPATLDMCATSIMYLGLNLTYASSFQMLRGSVIVFTEIFSMIFLQRQFKAFRWAGIFVIIIGLATVGLSDLSENSSDSSSSNQVILGDILIIIAQVITATQMVYEEKYCIRLDAPPLKAVGCEGLFGLLFTVLLLLPLNNIHVPKPYQNNPNGTIEDLHQAYTQVLNKPLLLVPLLGGPV
ncbi:solute carrier family 35 member F6 isoform X2 [Nilaparvata lugens]|uniref:solute carrier family 35 member F6 isoform X2 n=1 Tax=Nilaparvata lugens TaxID=108931 RepID=UPI00193D1586|nr:solute carrier family 35 member F6 isoform X2 [Nilaparvata lugens]